VKQKDHRYDDEEKYYLFSVKNYGEHKILSEIEIAMGNHIILTQLHPYFSETINIFTLKFNLRHGAMCTNVAPTIFIRALKDESG
jgi:hypothetical protein